MTRDLRRVEALLRAMPEPDPAATARLRQAIAARLAREPLPVPDPWWRSLLPVGCGALGMALCCALWLAMPAAPSGDFLTGLAALPFAEETL
jgi:hypothetical protein